MPKKCDHEKIFAMHTAGKSQEEIAREVGCKANTVYKILLEAGRIPKQMTSRTREYRPIHQEEIEQFRDNLRIGEEIWLKARTYRDDYDRSGKPDTPERSEKCRITEKHKNFLVAVNKRGFRRTALYVDLIREERKKTLA